MSRLIVKGLPATMTEQKLRSIFSERGTVTDCQLKYTREGKFRRFAFVGFDNERDAEDARHHLNQSFINASRIEVDICKPFGDDTKPRAWSKYAKDSSAYQRKNPTEANEKAETFQQASKKSKLDPNKDPKFAEFLEVQNKSGLFEPKDGDDEQVATTEDLIVQLLRGVSGVPVDFDAFPVVIDIVLFLERHAQRAVGDSIGVDSLTKVGDTKQSLTIRGLPPTVKQKSVKEWLAPIRLKAMKIVRNDAEAAAFISFNRMPDVRRALTRNGEFLGGFKVEIAKIPTSGRSAGTAEDDDESAVPLEDRKTENEKITAAILDTGRLFIRNLPYVCTNESLDSLFGAYGEIADLTLVIDKKTGKSKGFAVVTFVFPENAAAAYAALDGTIFQGRMLHLLPGEEKRDAPNGAEMSTSADAKSSFKKLKEAKQKANVGQSHTWNALFLGANAVADTLAAKLNTTKAALLDADGATSAGVRMALGETRLVREAREFLLANNVSLDSFSRPNAKRSDTVIIAKNLSAGVNADELRRMFQRYGDVGRVLMPPEGGISALIEMSFAEDAKKAFKALAYSRLRTMPLYLEWAPGDVFGTPKDDDVKPQPKSEESPVDEKNDEEMDVDENNADNTSGDDDDNEEAETKEVDVGEKSGEEGAEQDEEVAEPETTLFVKNLNFETTDESLRAKFESIGDLRSAVVSKKRDPANPTSTLSMGFGFVQFYRRADAQRAIKELQGEMLDGHSLELKLSHRESTKDADGKRKGVSLMDQGDSTKLLVRNLPFQASRKELQQLFGAFGELRSLRIPKKTGSGDAHRGFGFVDYLTKADAKRAFEALVHSTHLYGRRLVLEWAKSEETLGELREKTAEHFATGADRRAVGKAKRKIAQDLAVIDDD